MGMGKNEDADKLAGELKYQNIKLDVFAEKLKEALRARDFRSYTKILLRMYSSVSLPLPGSVLDLLAFDVSAAQKYDIAESYLKEILLCIKEDEDD